MRKIVFILTFGVFLISCEKAIDTPSKEVNFDHKILDGYFVTSIAFDNLGNAWIGTFKQGLIKYNNDETIVYNSKNSTIPDSSVINDISVDSKNNVWIGCNGLIRYDGKCFTYFNKSNTPIPEDFVRSIAIDSEDNVWFTSSRFRQGGIVKFDGKNWTVFTPDNSDLPVNSVQSIAIDKNDKVWIALSEMVGESYLVSFANNRWKTYTKSDLGFIPYYFGNIQINSENKICGAIDYSLSSSLFNNGPQVFIFDGKSSEKLQFDSITNISSITVDNQDDIWCFGYDGYSVYDGQNWIIDKSSFIEVGVFTIEQAKDNKIWIGTGDGIYIND
jgi:ligand-binding sensor domain-containing protein